MSSRIVFCFIHLTISSLDGQWKTIIFMFVNLFSRHVAFTTMMIATGCLKYLPINWTLALIWCQSKAIRNMERKCRNYWIWDIDLNTWYICVVVSNLNVSPICFIVLCFLLSIPSFGWQWIKIATYFCQN